MKKHLLAISFFFVLALAVAMAARTYFSSDPNPYGLIGAMIGSVLAYFLGSRFMAMRQKARRWAEVIVFTLGGPLLLFALVSIFLSLFSVKVGAKPVVFLGIYAFALPFSFWFSIYHLDSLRKSSTPPPDERLRLHYAWSATASFVFLSMLILAALVQPWIAIGTVWLWVSVLAASFLFWVAGVVVLNLKK